MNPDRSPEAWTLFGVIILALVFVLVECSLTTYSTFPS